MIKIYNTDLQTNKTEESQEYNKGAWINMTAPTDDEIKKVCSKLKISEDFLKYPLDSEEKARIDIDEEEKTVLFIVDVPVIEKQDKEKVYSTMPLGMLVVRDDFFVTISLKQNKVISDLEKLKDVCTYKKSRLILQIFYKNAELYLNNLKKIKKRK